MKSLRRWFVLLATLSALCLAMTEGAAAQQPSQVIPFNNLATNYLPNSTQSVIVQLWDATSTTPLFSESHPNVSVEPHGEISFVFGSLTSHGLDPNNFPSGSSRFLDVIDATTQLSVLTNGRVPLHATPFALTPGPPGPPGPGIMPGSTISGNVSGSILTLNNSDSNGSGVAGVANAPSGVTFGVYGTSASINGYGVVGAGRTGVQCSADGGGDIGVQGIATNGALAASFQGGNVGIGTTVPQGKLHVANPGSVFLRIEDTSGGGNLLDITSDSALGVQFRRQSSLLPMTFMMGSNERMRITDAGNVGIGTPTPGAKLDVTGNINATGSVTGASFSGGVTTTSLNCTGCVGNTQLGVNYAGSASQGGPATSALTATTATNALAFGGVAPSGYAPATGSPNYVAKVGDTMFGTPAIYKANYLQFWADCIFNWRTRLACRQHNTLPLPVPKRNPYAAISRGT